MGNSASSAGRTQQEETVDYGFLQPQGVYTGSRDWNQGIVTQLILDRRLAPFYRPLEEYDESWDDEQILAARKELSEHDVATSESSGRIDSSNVSRSSSFGNTARRSPTVREFGRIPEAMVYRGAVECPICFLYYPPNINHSRCCDQAICTECFVQIKRNEPTTTHLVSEPAACPYCVQENFGVTYAPPPWRTGLASEGSPSPQSTASRTPPSDTPTNKDKGRRKSFSPDSAEVVTIDQIRPDWEAKLAAVRAAVARRANRRIIMRQVGDRLIPVGVTSGRIQPLNMDIQGGEPAEGGEGVGETRSSRRSRRRQHQQAPQDLSHLLGSMGLGGQDLEELMIMEAMRLSLLDHEEQQRREAAEKKKAAQEGGSTVRNEDNGAGPSTSTARVPASPIPSSTPRDIPSGRPGPPSDMSGSPALTSSVPHSGSPASGSHLSARTHTPTLPSPLSNAILSASAPASAIVAPVGASRSLRIDTLSASTPGRRTPSPLPRRNGEQQGSSLRYSTLSAALATHSTAAAIIGTGGGDAEMSGRGGNTEEQRSGEQSGLPDGSSGSARVPDSSGSSTPANVDTKANADGVDGTNERQKFERKSTASSSVVGSAARYDELPSSPESAVSRQPLLQETHAEEILGTEQERNE